MAEPLAQQEIDDISAEADRFSAEVSEEEYLHFSGQKETRDLAPIYERHTRLTELDTATAAASKSVAKPRAVRLREVDLPIDGRGRLNIRSTGRRAGER